MAPHIADHPLVKHKLGILHQHDLPVRDFKAVSNEICRLLTYEATKNFETETVTVEGWAGPVAVERIKGKKVTAVPILRAGIGMMEGFLDMIPSAKVSIVGMFRDEESLEPVSYYAKFVKDMEELTAVILDPMLVTDGTFMAAVNLLKAAGCKWVIGLFLVGAPEGAERVLGAHPDLEVYLASPDEWLNDRRVHPSWS